MRSVSSGVVLVAYCLWAFERADLLDVTVPWYQISILPFTTAVFRYAQLLEAGEGGAPEELVLRDRLLLAASLCWARPVRHRGAGRVSGPSGGRRTRLAGS